MWGVWDGGHIHLSSPEFSVFTILEKQVEEEAEGVYQDARLVSVSETDDEMVLCVNHGINPSEF